MSKDGMRIEWDSALVAALAGRLDRAGRNARVRALHLDPVDRRVSLYLRDGVWVWDLHPERTAFRVLAPREAPEEAARLPATLRAVKAFPDDRVMELRFSRLRGRPSKIALVLELIPNRENALVLHDDERTIRRLLRTREESDRALVRGRPYEPPTASGRHGAESPWTRDAWMEHLLPLPPDERRRALVSGVAWTSPIVSDALLGDAAELDGPAAEAALERGWSRWAALRRAAVDPDAQEPAVLLGRGKRTAQPYPVPVADRTIERSDDLLDAFARAAESAGSHEIPLLPGSLVGRLRDEVDRVRGRLARLQDELAGLEDPAPVRARGDLLLARFGDVPTGAASVSLVDFEGEPVEIALDPKLSPDANARRLYDRAARIERAAARLPGMISDAERDLARTEALAGRVEAGEVAREELEAALPDLAVGSGGEESPALPYRRYRSSGGLEIRVGRGAARNDDLTFHHSRPDDVWMHASQVPGAHVILRWDGDGAPPARDLMEAATLAAWFSKARTSGSVPVAWTRRKYVRKPRKAAPGSVVPDRVETVFVNPDRAVEERLREES
jgi:predicted ribosome quality control (RQC) complex YloA/Tae2 family protein